MKDRYLFRGRKSCDNDWYVGTYIEIFKIPIGYILHVIRMRG